MGMHGGMHMTSGRRKVGRTASAEIRCEAAGLARRYRELDEAGAFSPDGARVMAEDGSVSVLHANPHMLLFALERLAQTGRLLGDERGPKVLEALCRHRSRKDQIADLAASLNLSEKAAELLLSERLRRSRRRGP